MKSYEVNLSLLANSDLESIHSYISDKLLSNYSVQYAFRCYLKLRTLSRSNTVNEN